MKRDYLIICGLIFLLSLGTSCLLWKRLPLPTLHLFCWLPPEAVLGVDPDESPAAEQPCYRQEFIQHHDVFPIFSEAATVSINNKPPALFCETVATGSPYWEGKRNTSFFGKPGTELLVTWVLTELSRNYR